MSSIRSILEEHTENIWQLFNDKTDIKGDVKPSIDQALSDISKIIDEAKPKHLSPSEKGLYVSDMDWRNGRCSGINEYQSNLKERLGL